MHILKIHILLYQPSKCELRNINWFYIYNAYFSLRANVIPL